MISCVYSRSLDTYTPEQIAEENAQTSDVILEYLLAVSSRMAHLVHPETKGAVQMWINRGQTNSLRLQVARMSADAATMEEFWLKYGHKERLPREDMYQFFFHMKHTPPEGCGG